MLGDSKAASELLLLIFKPSGRKEVLVVDDFLNYLKTSHV